MKSNFTSYLIIALTLFSDLSFAEDETTFFDAVINNDIQIVKSHIKTNLNINQKYTRRKKTALMAAAIYEHTDIIKVLLSNNADPFITDRSGKSALEYAVQMEKKDSY